MVAEVSSGRQAAELAHELQPQVAIVDVGMRELIGVEATGQMLRRSASTAVLILSMHNDETRIMEKTDVHSAAELVLSAVRRGLAQ